MSASRSLNTNKDGDLEIYVLSKEFVKSFPVCSTDSGQLQNDQDHMQGTNQLTSSCTGLHRTNLFHHNLTTLQWTLGET